MGAGQLDGVVVADVEPEDDVDVFGFGGLLPEGLGEDRMLERMNLRCFGKPTARRSIPSSFDIRSYGLPTQLSCR